MWIISTVRSTTNIARSLVRGDSCSTSSNIQVVAFFFVQPLLQPSISKQAECGASVWRAWWRLIAGIFTQLCVLPEARGRGVGYELMRHSLQVLREFGCQRASLTVTRC